MFTQIFIDSDDDIFTKLSSLTKFEHVAKGRYGAVIGDITDEVFPLVRTTTKYLEPSQKFNEIHYSIIDKIKKESKIKNLKLNNALIEIYDSDYKKMGFHSDQALDLAKDSYICIYSCYNNPIDLRKLIIKNKISEKKKELIMKHNSVIIFSTETNLNYQHKIILPKVTCDTKWLGITFRMSKTNIYFKDKKAYFKSNNKELRIANETEAKEFYKLRRLENKSIYFTYPELEYTLSKSDIINILV